MWPMVPIVHMYYRMTQLARGFALNAAMAGPSHIFIVLVCPYHTTPAWTSSINFCGQHTQIATFGGGHTLAMYSVAVKSVKHMPPEDLCFLMLTM